MKRKGRKDVVGDVVIRTIYVGGGLWEHVVTEPDYTVWELVDSRWKAMQWHGCHRSYLRFVRQMRNGPRPLVPGVIKKHR